MKENLSTIKQRMLEHIHSMRISKRNFYMQTGISNGVLDKETGLSEDNILRYLKAFPEINPTWLMTGEGNMHKNHPHPEKTTSWKWLPLITDSDLNTLQKNGRLTNTDNTRQHYSIPKFNSKQIDFLFEVNSSSMYPTYKPGDLVACTVISPDNFIQWNKPYLITTKQQDTLIKRIRKGSDNDHFTLDSDNPEHHSFEIPRNEIEGIALISGLIRQE